MLHSIEILRPGTYPASSGEVTIDDTVIADVIATFKPDRFKPPLTVTHDLAGQTERTIPVAGDVLLSQPTIALSPKGLSYGSPISVTRTPAGGVKAWFNTISPTFLKWAKEDNLLSVSPGLYRPSDPGNPTPGKWCLKHIAGLGDEPPAQKGMDPLTSGLNLSELPGGAAGVSVFHNPALVAPVKTVGVMSLTERLKQARKTRSHVHTRPPEQSVELAEKIKAARASRAATLLG